MVYSEHELILPALKLLKRHPKSLNTTQLIRYRAELKPTGHDVEIISGRDDDYFSQSQKSDRKS